MVGACGMTVGDGPATKSRTSAEHLSQCLLHGAASRTATAKQRTVYVEKNKFHDLVSNTPDMIVPTPITCHPVGTSCRKIQATVSAITG